jgi:hypothetical protein
MKIVRVLFVSGPKEGKELFSPKANQGETIRIQTSHAPADQAEDVFDDLYERLDIILFSDGVPTKRTAFLTKYFRERNSSIPIFLLSTRDEDRLPRALKRAGVDDFFHQADVDSPLFVWTFTSTVENATVQKKAREYDVLHGKLQEFKKGFGKMLHDINSPLSIIRLALYHIDNSELTPEKRESYLRLLIDNIRRVEARIGEFQTLKRHLEGDKATRTRILSIRSNIRSAGGR